MYDSSGKKIEFNVLVNEKLFKEISRYADANGLDVTELMSELVSIGFNIERFGQRPFDVNEEKPQKPIKKENLKPEEPKCVVEPEEEEQEVKPKKTKRILK